MLPSLKYWHLVNGFQKITVSLAYFFIYVSWSWLWHWRQYRLFTVLVRLSRWWVVKILISCHPCNGLHTALISTGGPGLNVWPEPHYNRSLLSTTALNGAPWRVNIQHLQIVQYGKILYKGPAHLFWVLIRFIFSVIAFQLYSILRVLVYFFASFFKE